MDAIILAAGRGTRLRPLTDKVPKPLLPVAGKGTLLHTLESLPASVDRIILVVGYLQDVIRRKIGVFWHGRPVEYVTQDKLDGTGGALRRAESLLAQDDFLVLNGDDLYGSTDLEILARTPHSLLVQTRELAKTMDIWIMRENILRGIAACPAGLVMPINIGAYHLDRTWFDTAPVLAPGKSDEWSLPHAIPQLILQDGRYLGIDADFWQPCGTFEEIAQAEELLKVRQ